MEGLKTSLLRQDIASRSDRPSWHLGEFPKKRGHGVRSWIRIDNAGNAHVLEADKFTIMKRCQLPARDLRLLDPLFVYPSTILGREKAIVVNLEQIRCVITADEALLLNSMDSYMLQFVTVLQHRLAPKKHTGGSSFEWRFAGSQRVDMAKYPGLGEKSESPVNQMPAQMSVNQTDGLEAHSLPFEFIVMEVALETVCTYLDTQTAELEEEAYPLLEEFASKVNTLNLERVRRLKSRLVGLKRRVQRVRDEIEQLMDDDQDMAEMYLTDTSERAKRAGAVSAPVSPVTSPQFGRLTEKSLSFGRNRTENKANSENNVDRVDELEMLLESYFVVVDGILNKLTSLEEYIDDTEDLINIHLDNVRNQLIQIELVLTTATFVMAFYAIVTGAFGMNVPVPLAERPWAFKWILTIAGLVGLIIFLAFMLFFRWRKLMPL